MVSETSIKDQSFDFIDQDLLCNLLTQFSENCLEFSLPLQQVEVPHSIHLHNQLMYEGGKTTVCEETAKAQLSTSDGGLFTTPQEIQPLSRQSSLVEEWFGNITNTCPNDISVDASLEALFANIEWPDFKAEMPSTTDNSVTENDNCSANSSVYHSVNHQSAANMPAEETIACKPLSVCTAVCKTELQPVVVPENAGEYSSPCTEGIFHFFIIMLQCHY